MQSSCIGFEDMFCYLSGGNNADNRGFALPVSIQEYTLYALDGRFHAIKECHRIVFCIFASSNSKSVVELAVLAVVAFVPQWAQACPSFPRRVFAGA